jgi:hypothetical protein
MLFLSVISIMNVAGVETPGNIFLDLLPRPEGRGKRLEPHGKRLEGRGQSPDLFTPVVRRTKEGRSGNEKKTVNLKGFSPVPRNTQFE